jgi:putative DNA primase/helicase
MCAQASKLCGSMRDGDQIGTLMAGAWMVSHDGAATAAEAYEYLQAMNLNALRQETDEKTDEEQCLDEILATKIEVANNSGRAKMTIGSAIAYWFEQEEKSMTQSGSTEFPAITQESIRRELDQWGIRLMLCDNQEYLKIAVAHPAIRKALMQTGWSTTYAEMLKRLDGFVAVEGPERFGGIPKRYIKIKADKITENVPF